MKKFLSTAGKGMGLLTIVYLLFQGAQFFLGLVIALYLQPDTTDEAYDLEHSRTIDIVAVQDATKFVVGRASSSGGQELYYMEERDGKFYPDSYYAGWSSIVESDEKPHIKVYRVMPKEHKELFREYVGKHDSIDYQLRYEFHVPKGSIDMQFNVDLD